MATSSRISFEDFMQLPDDGARYELDEGELLMVPSPAPRHNLIRQRIAVELMQVVKAHKLGIVLEEMDFRLGPETVRKPDIAFITKEALRKIDLDRSPVEGGPALAVEVISPGNRAEDTVKKVHQYLDAGCEAVWLVFSRLRLIEIHSRVNDIPQRIDLTAPHAVLESAMLPGFSLSLSDIFDDPTLG